MEWTEIRERIVSLLYPQRCVLCGEVVEYDDLWCGKCAFRRAGRVECGLPNRFAGALAAVDYDGGARLAVWRLKDKRDMRSARFFAEEMWRAVGECWGGVPFDVVVPVPTTAAKLAARGYNPAEFLAGLLCGSAGAPMETGILLRREDTRDQRTLPREARLRNAVESYGIARPDAAAGRAVLLVDDVFTTGATLATCAGLLDAAGARSVHVVTAARTCCRKAPEPRGGKTAALVGHRFHTRELPFGGASAAADALRQDMAEAIDRLIGEEGVTSFACGLSPGAELLGCELLLERAERDPRLTLEIAAPFPAGARQERRRALRPYLTRCEAVRRSGKAAERFVPAGSGRRAAYMQRNRYLAKGRDFLLAVWSGAPDETGLAVRLAEEDGASCVALDPRGYASLL